MTARLGVLRESLLPVPLPPIRLEVKPRSWIGRVHEHDIERALIAHLGRAGRRAVRPQRSCHGFKPDIVINWRDVVSGHAVLTIVELKRWYIDGAALGQLTGYVDHALWEAQRVGRDVSIFGVLAAPAIDPKLWLPMWCVFQPLLVTEVR